MAKKLDEIKEAISANSTPIKNGVSDYASHDELGSEDLNSGRSRRVSSEYDVWGRFSESRKSSFNNLVPLGEGSSSSNLTLYPVLPDCIYPDNNKDVSFYQNVKQKKNILKFSDLGK